MQAITTIGFDIAKSVFQVHGVDAEGNVILRRQLKRRYVLAFFQKLPPCLVGIEACAWSHHWSRELQALGHTVRLMPPAYAVMTENVHQLRPKPSDSEKITINLGYVDLGHIDLMVQDGFYSNRTDFIRTAIRNQLERHAEVVKQSTARKSLDLGLRNYSREDLEVARSAGQMGSGHCHERQRFRRDGQPKQPTNVSEEVGIQRRDDVTIENVKKLIMRAIEEYRNDRDAPERG